MSMLFNFRPLVINPELATRIGLNEAIVLQQVNYWINDKEQGVIHSGRRWVFNSYESWVKQFPFWSADTVKRAFTSLVKQGCLDVEQLNKSQHDRTNYYTINHDCELLNDAEQVPSSNGASCPDRQVQDAPMDEGKNARSLMVTTTKTTTEIKNTLGASAGNRLASIPKTRWWQSESNGLQTLEGSHRRRRYGIRVAGGRAALRGLHPHDGQAWY